MRVLLLLFIGMLFMTNTVFAEVSITDPNLAEDPENTVILQLKDGPVYIQLFPTKAPNHVKRILELTRDKFYDGLVFHRVIDGFMVQTGDPTGTGTGRSSKPNLKAEFNDIKHERGVCSMARSADPDSANSQFFIMLAPAPHLDGQYTAWGKVISGMEFVDSIKKGDSKNNGAVENPDKIVNMNVVKDLISKQPTSSGDNNAANSANK